MTPSDPLPDEESPVSELHDHEIVWAIESTSALDVAAKIKATRCARCSLEVAAQGHKMLARSPHRYWRVALQCAAGHSTHVLFRVNWITTPTKGT